MMHLAFGMGDFVNDNRSHAHVDGEPLPAGLRWAIEMLSGYDMSDVRVYYASALPAEVGARAYAYGTSIYIEAGAEDALPHEAWHVVQQKQGRVPETANVQDAPLNDDPLLEMEADAMGAAAAKLSLSAAWSRLKRILSRDSVDKPVVQRVVTIGDSIVSTANTIRDRLSIWHNVTATNTPHLTAIVNDIVAKNRTFPDLLAVKNEVKRRSFGLQHVDAMSTLRQRQETAIGNYMNTNNVANRDDLSDALYTKRKNSSSRRLLQVANQQPPFTFIHWMAATYMSQVVRQSYARRTDIYRWLRDPVNVLPYAMNCWESVLYSATWTDGGTRTALCSRDYALFALQHATTPMRSFENPNQTINVPYFVKQVIDHPIHHATNRDNNGNNRVLPIPADIEAGTIIVLNSGQHVALATGRRRAISSVAARNRYPGQGHEILELDGATDWMVVSTLEDSMGRGYNIEMHLGRLPDVANQTPIRIRDTNNTLLLQADVPVTRLYV